MKELFITDKHQKKYYIAKDGQTFEATVKGFKAMKEANRRYRQEVWASSVPSEHYYSKRNINLSRIIFRS